MRRSPRIQRRDGVGGATDAIRPVRRTEKHPTASATRRGFFCLRYVRYIFCPFMRFLKNSLRCTLIILSLYLSLYHQSQQKKTFTMTVKRHYLTQDEMTEQFKAANFYKSLIQKELAFENLCNLENIQIWAKAYKRHMELISIGFVEVEFEYSNY